MRTALPVFRDYSPDEHLLASSLLGSFALMYTANTNKPRLDWLKRESTLNCKAQDLDHELKKAQERTGIDIQLIGLFFFFWDGCTKVLAEFSPWD